MEKLTRSLLILVITLAVISVLATGYQTFMVNEFVIDYSEEE